jgi:predicted RNase H-like HicB family nuclease
MKFTVEIHDEEKGGFWAEVPELTGTLAFGRSSDEVALNIREAILLQLQGLVDEYAERAPFKRGDESPSDVWEINTVLKLRKSVAA